MRLDERVTILKKSVQTDQYGEEQVTFAEDRIVFAQVERSTPSESRTAGREEETTSITVTMRTSTAEGITREDRLRWRGDDLQVQGRISNPDRSGFVTLQTTRVR
jgi:SPP1 family predicted phage head-tail adaptor